MQRLLAKGDYAPDFELPASNGGRVHLYETLERSGVVLFFLVKAFTPVCTAEACAFRDHLEDFLEYDAAVFGISSDAPERAKQFLRFFHLPFPLLLDTDERVRHLYRVPKLLGLVPERATFVIGQNRRIEQIIQAPFHAKQHIRESLEALRTRA